MVIVKLGGTNGSGKTSVARALLASGLVESYIYNGKKIRGYVCDIPTYPNNVVILGSYENVCGGMDTITDKEERLALIKRYANPELDSLMFFEGLITGKTFGAIGELSLQNKPRWIYAYMDTPFDVCVERVLQRRAARGASVEGFDPARTMRPTYRSVELTRARAQREGFLVLDLDHTASPEKLARKVLTAAGGILV